MKKINFVAIIIALFSLSFSLSSCGEDDKENLNPDNASAITGTYIGKLTYGTELIEDVYIIHISRLSSNTVSMSADFLDSSEYRYNIIKEDNVYSLVNEGIFNINISITGNILIINYTTVNGIMFTFKGTKE